MPAQVLVQTTPRLYRTREAALILGLSVPFMKLLVQRRQIESIRIGTAVRIPADAIDSFIAARRGGGESAA